MNQDCPSNRYSPWLHGLTCLSAVATWFLICLGGHVTSTESGLAVPDWPTSYGFNMFLFPWTRMVGGIFWEHSHRLLASVIGLLTLVMTLFFFLNEKRQWVKLLALTALLAVVIQGLLGGLRVVWLKAELGIFHAALAQAFFGLLCFLSWVSSKKALKKDLARSQDATLPWKWLQKITFFLTAAIFLQLILGASMRHEHAGLAIPDFPLAYGHLLPPLDEASLGAINTLRQDVLHMPPTSRTQILLHMGHRLVAALLLLGFVFFGLRAWKYFPKKSWVRAGVLLGVGLISIQVMLGVATIWSHKAAEVATAHVAVGAAILAWAVVVSARASEEAGRI